MKAPGKLKITFEYTEPRETEFSVTIPDESTVDEVAQTLRALMLAVGYHPDNVEEVIPQQP